MLCELLLPRRGEPIQKTAGTDYFHRRPSSGRQSWFCQL